jgi:hypothetical protein
LNLDLNKIPLAMVNHFVAQSNSLPQRRNL